MRFCYKFAIRIQLTTKFMCYKGFFMDTLKTKFILVYYAIYAYKAHRLKLNASNVLLSLKLTAVAKTKNIV